MVSDFVFLRILHVFFLCFPFCFELSFFSFFLLLFVSLAFCFPKREKEGRVQLGDWGDGKI